MDTPPPGPFGRWLVPLLKLRLWTTEHLRPGQLQITLFWAGIIGVLGATASVAFRYLTSLVQSLLTGHNNGLVETFSDLKWWQALLIPTFGGLLAGATLYFGARLKSRTKSSTDYMEAIVIGDGVVSARQSLVKSLSALFTIASGGSIGREGPLVQLSAMLASLLGRMQRKNPVQLRLLVACGAAAGIASAYNAPIAGALFVAEIILGTVAMETFGPLVFSSVIATLTVHAFLGSDPLYSIPPVQMRSNWEIIPYLLLGVVSGIAASGFLRLLKTSEHLFARLHLPLIAKLAVGGLCVGILAVFRPEVCGNGYSVATGVLRGEWVWTSLLIILVCKVIATSASFGSGSVGGVFTPTLFLGACLGSLFAQAVQPVWPEPLSASSFAVVGMGAMLAATTHAPIMAIIMLFELTLDYQIILPLMLACVVGHYTSLAFDKASIYSEAFLRKGAADFNRQLAGLRVADLMKQNPPAVGENAGFQEIAQNFIRYRFNYLYVISSTGRLLGAISLHDIKNYLNEPDLAQIVIARDLLREGFPTINRNETLAEALQRFAHHDGERLPVTDSTENSHLEGSISKTDLLLALTEQLKETEKEPVGKPAAA
jgi:CIC family chloride channel protein